MTLAEEKSNGNLFNLVDKMTAALDTTRITGTLVDVPPDHPMRAKGLTAIHIGCVCATEPCDCEDTIIIWLPPNAIRSQSASSHKSHDDEVLTDFLVDQDARLIVETFSSMRARQFASRLTLSRRHPLLSSPRPLLGARSFRQVDYWCNPTEHVMYEVTETGDGGLGTTFTYTAVASC
jgi:hypothetical protein